MSRQIKKGQQINWDLASPYFRHEVRDGDESAGQALRDAIGAALQDLDAELGDVDLDSEQVDYLHDHIVGVFTDKYCIQRDDNEIADLEREEVEEAAEKLAALKTDGDLVS